MGDHLSVKVSFTLLPSPSPQIFYARIRQPIPVTRAHGDDTFAQVSLKACLNAICKTRPEMLLDLSNVDYSIASLDYQETQYVRDNKLADQAKGLFVSPIKAIGHDKVWEGKGLLSWALQSAPEAEEELIIGKVDTRSSALEVCLQLTERKAARNSFLDSLYSSSASPTFPAAPSPASISGLSPSAFPDSMASAPAVSITAWQEPQPQQDLMINVIQPTPVRNDLNTTRTIPPTSSSPAAIAASHPKRALSAPLNSPLLSAPSEETVPSVEPIPAPNTSQQQQVLSLIQQLLPQFQANPQESAAVMPLIQTLVQYLAAPPPPTPSTSQLDKESPPPVSSFLTMESLASLLSTARSNPSVHPPAAAPQMGRSESARLSNSTSSATNASKRKRDGSAPPSLLPSSSALDIDVDQPKSKTKKARQNSAQAGTDEVEPNKLKYDALGCSNCGTHRSILWRKKKKGVQSDRLCNPCGVYFNRVGNHRPVDPNAPENRPDFGRKPIDKANKRASSASVTPNMNSIDIFSASTSKATSMAMKPSMTSPPRRPDDLSNLGKRSPRRHTISSPARNSVPNFVTTDSPGTALLRIMSDAPTGPVGGEEGQPKKKKIKARPSVANSESASADFFAFKPAFSASMPAPATSASVASSVFSEQWQHEDLFSTMTSEMDPLQSKKRLSSPARHGRAQSSGGLEAPFDYNAIFSDQDWIADHLDVDMNNIFSDALTAPSPAGHPALFNNSVKRHQPDNPLSDIAPSSPPFKHLLSIPPSETGESPSNASEVETPTSIAGLSTSLTAPTSNVVWSEEAVSFLTHALTQEAGNNNLDLAGLGVDLGDPATLQDLFASLTSGLSPGSVGTPPTAGLDVGLVKNVDAETAMEIWEKEVQARFSGVSAAQ